MNEKDELISELELLLSCFLIASEEDRAAVWNVLQEYISLVNDF